MEITNIHPTWGTIVNSSIEELLDQDDSFWRELGYKRDMIVFRGQGKISDTQYYHLISKFGRPWSPEEYKHSNESLYHFDDTDLSLCFTKFSNKLSNLGNVKMPWHVDIPNWGEKSFPWRSLYIVNNPNPTGGITSWLNLRLSAIQPTEEDLELYKRMKVLNQSWYGRTEEGYNLFEYIKRHPITGVESLRSNYFVSHDSSPHAWIKQVLLDGNPIDNYELLGSIHSKLSAREDLVYKHKWQDYDIIIYDNWNLMHRRSSLNLNASNERLFLRANIHHINN